MDLQEKTLGASERDEQARSAWRQRVSRFDPRELIFVDECGTNVALTPLRSRAPKGERAFGEALRNRGKNTTLLASMGAKRFKDMAERDYGVEMSLAEAKEAKRKLLDAYPRIGDWHTREGQECERENFVTETLMGRRRIVEPDPWGKPSFTERLNAPVQGTAADILKLALARLWESREAHPEAVPILSVHDEIVIECDAEAAHETVRYLGNTLGSAVEDVLGHPELAGPDVVETCVVGSWGEA